MKTNKEYALQYAQLGWHVIPLKPNEKRPLPGGHGVHDATTNTEQIKEWWDQHPDAGIGIAMGEISGVFAVDIDPRNGGDKSLEQLIAENTELPDTVMALTGGNGEHYLYEYPNSVEITKQVLMDGIDIISNNAYIVVEPSIHPSGNAYTWEGSSDPLEGIQPTAAPQWLLDKLVNKCLTSAANDPDHSAANDPVHSSATPIINSEDKINNTQIKLVGIGFIDKDQVKELRAALGYLDSDPREMWLNVGMALHSTSAPNAFGIWSEWSQGSDKYDAAGQKKTWNSFSDGYSEYEDTIHIGSVFHWAAEAGYANNGTIEAQARPKELKLANYEEDVFEAIPHTLLKPPGIMGEMINYIVATAPKPQPVFALTASICMMGSVLARKVATQTGLRTNMYMISVGDSGCGKDHPRLAVKKMLLAANAGHLLASEEIASAQALLNSARINPGGVHQLDEWGHWLKAMQNQNSGSHLTLIPSIMMKLFSSTDSIHTGTVYANSNERPTEPIPYPCIGIHGTTTPETLYPALKSRDILDGFLNRILVLSSEDDPEQRIEGLDVAIPASILHWIGMVIKMSGDDLEDNGAGDMKGLNPATPFITQMDNTALKIFKEYLKQIDEYKAELKGTGAELLWVRAWEHAAKLALIVACGCVSDICLAVIKEDHAKWAIAFTNYSIKNTGKKVILKVADSAFEGMCKDCYAEILKTEARGLTDREMGRKVSAFRKLNPQERKNVMDSLTGAGMIGLIEVPSASGKGAKRYAWVALAEDDE